MVPWPQNSGSEWWGVDYLTRLASQCWHRTTLDMTSVAVRTRTNHGAVFPRNNFPNFHGRGSGHGNLLRTAPTVFLFLSFFPGTDCGLLRIADWHGLRIAGDCGSSRIVRLDGLPDYGLVIGPQEFRSLQLFGP